MKNLTDKQKSIEIISTDKLTSQYINLDLQQEERQTEYDGFNLVYKHPVIKNSGYFIKKSSFGLYRQYYMSV